MAEYWYLDQVLLLLSPQANILGILIDEGAISSFLGNLEAKKYVTRFQKIKILDRSINRGCDHLSSEKLSIQLFSIHIYQKYQPLLGPGFS